MKTRHRRRVEIRTHQPSRLRVCHDVAQLASPANVAVSKARAESTLAALKSIGAQGPFVIAGVGALQPASNGKTGADQAENRRVVIVLIP